MTKEEIMEMNMEQLEERRNAIVSEIETADTDALEALSAELDAIEERKSDLKRIADEKRAEMLEIIKGDGEVIEEKKEERKMENIEVRNTPEYLDAWVENIKGRATQEQRALLTENGGGTIAVPAYVEDRIQTAWESNELIRRFRRVYFPGNLRVGVEVSAEGAKVHQEGTAAVAEENLELLFVSLVPITFKKVVSYSTEVLDMKGEAFANYIIDEVTYQIVKTIIDTAVDAACIDNLTAEYDGGASFETEDIVNAEGLLAGDADAVLITTRANAAALKAAALAANYGYDPFDGLEVFYVDNAALDGSMSGSEACFALIVDPSAITVNFTNGDDVKITVDPYSKAAEDVVRVIGHLNAAVGLTAAGKSVRIKNQGSN